MKDVLLARICPERVRPEPFHWTTSTSVQCLVTQENFNLQALNNGLTAFSRLSGRENKCKWKKWSMFVVFKFLLLNAVILDVSKYKVNKIFCAW
jgi:hypothetical protein